MLSETEQASEPASYTDSAPRREGSRAFRVVVTVFCIACVAALIIIFNGGIGIGFSNHTGLVPVVRRILDPDYLPGDFGITLRFFHHRTFAHLVAGFSWLLGEDNALVALNVVGMTMLSAALFYVCRVLRLPLIAFLAVGGFLATNVGWTGRGLELNNFVGGRYIMPTTFAHAFVLLAVGVLLEKRYRAAAFLAGLALLFHLQIGLIFALLLLPFFALRARAFDIKELAYLTLLFLAPASLSLWHFSQMIQRGLLGPSLSLDHIDFRQAHHFELWSVGAAVWVAAHLGAQAAAYWWLRRARRAESREVGVLLIMSLILAAFSLVHFLDYYLLKIGTITKLQFLRMSPFITVFGSLSLVTAARAWADERSKQRNNALVNASSILAAALLIYCQVAIGGSNHYIGIRKYADEQSSWVDICRWISEHGPSDAIYLTPPGSDGFTYLSNRSNVVEFKINPDGAMYLSEWFERVYDLAGGTLPDGKGLENRLPLNQAFSSLRPDQLIALGKKYHAEYAVLPKSSAATFEAIYENEGYQLVRLPIQEEISCNIPHAATFNGNEHESRI